MIETKSLHKDNVSISTNSKILLKKFTKPSTLISLGLLFLIIFCAIFAPILAPTNPYDLKVVSILDSRLSPGDKMFNGTVAWLGTDGAGRDVLSAIIFGLRTSLVVAISSALIALTVGLFVGLIAGFYGGKIDEIGRAHVRTPVTSLSRMPSSA